MTHTPGPWEFNPLNDTIEGKNRETICEFCFIKNVANARLIAAAPEIYECLKEFIHSVDTALDFSMLLDAYVKAEALLRRIEGEEEAK